MSQVTAAQQKMKSTVLLVANYESEVGYAWWLMENFWGIVGVSARMHDWSCLLVYPRVSSVPENIRTAPIDVLEFSFGYRSLREVWNSLGLIRKWAIRSVYLTDWPYVHWSYLAWRIAGVRHIVVHDHTPGDRPDAVGARAMIKRVVQAVELFSATKYVAVSDYIAERLHRNGCIPRERIATVTNGIRQFECKRDCVRNIRKRIGVPVGAVLVVLVSRATYYKNLDFAVRCFVELLSDEELRGHVHVVHCGDGPDLHEFVSLASNGGIGDSFRFLGRRNDVQDILCASDIAFHPSNGEAMSLSILEFMCAGLAVLTSDLPSVCTAVQEGVTGLTYRHNDLQDAVAALRRLVSDPSLRKVLGTSASMRCRESYSLVTTNDQFCQFVVPELFG